MPIQSYSKVTGCPIFLACSWLFLSSTAFHPASATTVSSNNKLSPSFELAFNGRGNAGRARGVNRDVNGGFNQRGVDANNRNVNPSVNSRTVDPTVNQYNVYGDGQYNRWPASGVYQVPGNYCSRQCIGNILPNWLTYCQQYCR